MSNRLKRKLNDLGVDTSSTRANESFCLIGTPLPPLEKSRDAGEFVPLWKQEVRDEKGRRRLHGAFTGGFSAGYFNTVGSAEGWAPSKFVSSRGERAKMKSSRPEDFMDEDDLQELRENRSIVDTTEEMDLTGGTAAELKRRQGGDDPEQDSIIDALQSALLPPPTDSAGARILKKMGWRLGQGIGPRVSLRQRKLQDLQASSPYGTRVSADDIKVTEEDEEASKHTYAPRDTPILIVERKDDAHGLGYRPGATLHESLGSTSHAGAKGPTLAAGFGLGATNDADEDDLDIYDADPNTGRNRLAYDARHNDDAITIGRQVKASRQEKRSTSATFRDGTRVLEGFVLSENPLIEDRWFPLPDVPPNWQPDPRRAWEANKENIPRKLEVPKEPLSHGKWKSSRMTASERGNVLGETPLDTGPRSVFDYLSEKDRERLKNIASATASGVPVAVAAFSIPQMEPHVAEAALKGFQPFISDPVRQSRYTAYLQSQATPNDNVPPLQPLLNQPLDKFQRELEEYAKAAIIFKPATGAMAGRFQSAAHVEQAPTVHEGLHQPSAAELEELEKKRKKEEEEKVDPRVHAAKIGMYGVMTREVKPWQPARLLCKRFGVKEPELPPEESDSLAPGTRSAFDTSPQQESNPNSEVASSSQQSQAQLGSNGAPRDIANIGLGEDENQGRDTLTYQRPAMDVFKAIFASDDESDDGEDVDEPEVVKDGDQEMPATNGTKGPSAPLADTQPVDISTFKPTFIPRGGKAKETNDKGSDKEKAEKKKKKKEKRGPLVSFDVEDGMEGLSVKPAKDRPKKKKKKDRSKREDDEDEGMWVEKQAPDIVKDMQIPAPTDPIAASELNDSNSTSTSINKGRKRAIDFL